HKLRYLAVLQYVQRTSAGVADIYLAVIDGDIVEKNRAIDGVAIRNLAGLRVDLMDAIDVGHIQLSVEQTHAFRRIQSGNPRRLRYMSVERYNGDEPITVFPIRGAVDVRHIQYILALIV